MNQARCWLLFNRRALSNYNKSPECGKLSLFSPCRESSSAWVEHWSNGTHLSSGLGKLVHLSYISLFPEVYQETAVVQPTFLPGDIAAVIEILKRLTVVERDAAVAGNLECVNLATDYNCPPLTLEEQELAKINQMMVQVKLPEKPKPASNLSSRAHSSIVPATPSTPTTPSPRPSRAHHLAFPPNPEEERSLLLAALVRIILFFFPFTQAYYSMCLPSPSPSPLV